MAAIFLLQTTETKAYDYWILFANGHVFNWYYFVFFLGKLKKVEWGILPSDGVSNRIDHRIFGRVDDVVYLVPEKHLGIIHL